jgi:pescadillo protein
VSYYFKKDITHLSRDHVVETLRRLHTYQRRLNHNTAIRNEHALKYLELYKPEYDLPTLVRERYPTPDAAIADMDDCLSLIALFSTFSASQTPLAPRCRSLMKQFGGYVAGLGLLRRCFISTKGYYFQAIVHNQLVTWCEPHRFCAQVPEDVEMEVLTTFVDFYLELLKSIMIHLFKQLQLTFPLQVNDQEGDYVLAHATFVRKHMQQFGFKQSSLQQQVFTNQVYKLSREVPRDQFEFVALCGGGSVVSSQSANDDNVTHIVTDRPTANTPGRELVQPQYVFDSFNLGVCLPAYEYQVGQPLPPHLSPFQYDFTV